MDGPRSCEQPVTGVKGSQPRLLQCRLCPCWAAGGGGVGLEPRPEESGVHAGCPVASSPCVVHCTALRFPSRFRAAQTDR